MEVVELKDEKMGPEKTESKMELSPETTSETKTSLPLEPYTPFGEIKQKIGPVPPGSDAIIAPSDRQITADDIGSRGLDATRDIDIQEMGFLTILNLLPDEKARSEFLKWAKLESLKSASKEKTDKEIKISRSTKTKIKPEVTHKSRTHVKEHTRSGVSTRSVTTDKKHRGRSRRARR